MIEKLMNWCVELRWPFSVDDGPFTVWPFWAWSFGDAPDDAEIMPSTWKPARLDGDESK